MLKLKMNQNWIDQLMPDGFPFPSSTIISGPGGSGKPLIASLFASGWLKKGGSVTLLLINYDRDYSLKMLSLFGIQPQDYRGQLFFIDFNPEIESTKEIRGDSLSANLLKPEIWNKANAIAAQRLNTEGPGNLLLGGALNLLFFSKTYRDAIIDNLVTILKMENCIFSVSNNIFEDKILILENSADNLMFAHSEKPMKIFFKIDRMKNVSFLPDEVRVPLSEHDLLNMKAEAESARKNLIPIIKKI